MGRRLGAEVVGRMMSDYIHHLALGVCTCSQGWFGLGWHMQDGMATW